MANTPKYPTALATLTDLLQAFDGFQTVLAADLGPTDSSISVASGLGAGANCVVAIGSELILLSAAASGTLTVATGGRGFAGTTPGSWPSGTRVLGNDVAWHHNQTAAEIIALETALGASLANVVLPTRQIATDATLSGGGDLSANRTLSVIPDQTNQRVGISKGGAAVTGTRKQLNVIEGAGITLTVADNSGANRVDVTVAAVSPIADIEFVIDGGGDVIATGVKGDLFIDFPCTINQVTLLADRSGSIVVEIQKCTYAQFDNSAHPVTGDKLNGSGTAPTISGANKSQDSTLTSWNTSIAAGSVLRFVVNSCSTMQRCTVGLKVTKG
jgi:hypothetical protein